jgi:hypothetical protein
MRNAHKILGVKLEIPLRGEANIRADPVEETGYICSDIIHLTEDGYCVWSL